MCDLHSREVLARECGWVTGQIICDNRKGKMRAVIGNHRAEYPKAWLASQWWYSVARGVWLMIRVDRIFLQSDTKNRIARATSMFVRQWTDVFR